MSRTFFLAALAALGGVAQTTSVPFAPRMFGQAGRLMPYRLFVPETRATGPLPLVVWLHGASGAGTDNRRQVSEGGNELGSRLWVRPDIQAKFPAFVVAPQLPPGQQWGAAFSERLTPYGQLVIELVDALAREFPIDRNRVYLVGQSLGGIGVWDLISKRPDVFAAAVPLCAMGNPTRIATAVGNDVKVWAFHGARDLGMPVANVRDIVAALKAAGGDVRYTEFPDMAHDVWTRAFALPDLPAWLFAQRRDKDECIDTCTN